MSILALSVVTSKARMLFLNQHSGSVYIPELLAVGPWKRTREATGQKA